MDMIVAVSSAAVFGAGALIVFKAGPFLEQISRRMGSKRKVKITPVHLYHTPGVTEPAQEVEEPDKP